MKLSTSCPFVPAPLRAAAVSLATGAYLVAVASAQYATGFEAPTFVSGEVAGQDSWTVSRNPATARVLTASEIATELANVGLDSTNPVHSGEQALVVSGAGDSNAIIRVISGLENENLVVLDVWARPLTGGSTGNVFLTMEDSTGDRAAAFRFGTAFGMTIDYGTSVAGVWQPTDTIWDPNSWYRLTLRVDYLAKSYDFAIDGTPVAANPIPFYTSASDQFSQVRIFRGASQSGMIVDDLTVNIPEPTASVCLLLGLGVVFLRQRRSER